MGNFYFIGVDVSKKKLNFELGEKHTLSSGVEWIRDALVAPHRMATDRASTHTLSAYVQDEWSPTLNLNFTAGVRVVNHRSDGRRPLKSRPCASWATGICAAHGLAGSKPRQSRNCTISTNAR